MIIAIVVIIIGIVGIAVGVWLMSTPPSTSDEDGNPIAIIDTSKGVIKVELFEDICPKTCENFIKLANDGFYDGMIFHRVMDDFMIQAGNTYPDGSTKESPYGNIQFESDDSLSHVDGAISMASTGAGVGGSAQFFICDGAQSFLDGSYAVFGKTIEGIDVVRDIADEPHDSSYGSVGGGRPNTDIIISSITIED
jgi:peptidyl-prolyl cis-trans isomerase A (cyclophilin A)